MTSRIMLPWKSAECNGKDPGSQELVLAQDLNLSQPGFYKINFQLRGSGITLKGFSLPDSTPASIEADRAIQVLDACMAATTGAMIPDQRYLGWKAKDKETEALVLLYVLRDGELKARFNPRFNAQSGKAVYELRLLGVEGSKRRIVFEEGKVIDWAAWNVKRGLHQIMYRCIEERGDCGVNKYIEFGGKNRDAVSLCSAMGATSIYSTFTMPEPAEWVYGEIFLEEPVAGTFYSILNFDAGYFGLQIHDYSGSFAIGHSVWDAKHVPNAERFDEKNAQFAAKAILPEYGGAGVSAFDHEGSGISRYLKIENPDSAQKKDETKPSSVTIRFLMQRYESKEEPGWLDFVSYIYDPFREKWKFHFHCRRPKGNLPSGFTYMNSFVEDFAKYAEVLKPASIVFRNMCYKPPNHPWKGVVDVQASPQRGHTLREDYNFEILNNGFKMSTGGFQKIKKMHTKYKLNPPQIPKIVLPKKPGDIPISIK